MSLDLSSCWIPINILRFCGLCLLLLSSGCEIKPPARGRPVSHWGRLRPPTFQCLACFLRYQFRALAQEILCWAIPGISPGHLPSRTGWCFWRPLSRASPSCIYICIAHVPMSPLRLLHLLSCIRTRVMSLFQWIIYILPGASSGLFWGAQMHILLLLASSSPPQT